MTRNVDGYPGCLFVLHIQNEIQFTFNAYVFTDSVRFGVLVEVNDELMNPTVWQRDMRLSQRVGQIIEPIFWRLAKTYAQSLRRLCAKHVPVNERTFDGVSCEILLDEYQLYVVDETDVGYTEVSGRYIFVSEKKEDFQKMIHCKNLQ